MKKTILMFCLAALSFQVGNAQTDLQITELIPVTNGVYDSIAYYDTLTYLMVIKNNGPSNLNITDTVFLEMGLDWLIQPQGYIWIQKHDASTLNCLIAGSSDTLGFRFIQNVSIGQTASGNAIPIVPNHEYLNDIWFRVYGKTANSYLLNDPGATLDGNGYVIALGNNLLNPLNVIYGMQDTPVLVVSPNVNSICEGVPVTFTANFTDPGSNPSYEWKVNNMTVGTNSPTFTSDTLMNNDELVCVYTSMINGVSMNITSTPIIVTLFPLPVVNLGGDTSICDGDTLTLNSGNAGANFLWNDNSSNQTLNVTAEGTYFVTVNDGNCSASDTVLVSFREVPSADSIIVVNQGNCTFNFSIANAENAISYEWNFGDGSAADSGATVSHTYVSNSNFLVTLNMKSDCGVIFTLTKTVECTGVGIRLVTVEKDVVKLYPNPANDQITIENTSNLLMEQITIFNVLGQVVYQNTPQNTLKNQVDVSRMVSGLYTVRIKTNEGIVIRKFEILK